jgi:hypothetical protein
MSIKDNDIYKIARDTFEKYVYSIAMPFPFLLMLYWRKVLQQREINTYKLNLCKTFSYRNILQYQEAEPLFTG